MDAARRYIMNKSQYTQLELIPSNGVGDLESISYRELVESSAHSLQEQFATLLAILVDKGHLTAYDIQDICWDSNKFKYNFLSE